MKRTPNIIEAIENRKLFGSLSSFRTLDSWRPWFVALKTIFGLPMRAEELVLFSECTGRKSPPADGAKEVFIVVGRRGGKSYITALIACFVGCFTDFSAHISSGETLAILCLALDKPQARIVFRYIKAILNGVPALRAMITAERSDEIELINGIIILVKSADFGSVRGPTIPLVICDEVAFWSIKA